MLFQRKTHVVFRDCGVSTNDKADGLCLSLLIAGLNRTPGRGELETITTLAHSAQQALRGHSHLRPRFGTLKVEK